jgi:diaminopimelate epimerase
MELIFSKYHATGNDFILVDNRSKDIRLSNRQIAGLCDRHFGIGADGLMLLEQEANYDFKMVYYNSDGNESSMCGNGGRCIVAFAQKLGLIKDNVKFVAIDGPHSASIDQKGIVSLKMGDVDKIDNHETYVLLNTGSPHYVTWVDETDSIDVFKEGKEIRNSEPFSKEGINVNFVEKLNNGLKVRTYERGVEDETLSCGTGVTAAAIAYSDNKTGPFIVPIETPGGTLEVSFTKETHNKAKDVFLKGPAQFVFEGKILLES